MSHVARAVEIAKNQLSMLISNRKRSVQTFTCAYVLGTCVSSFSLLSLVSRRFNFPFTHTRAGNIRFDTRCVRVILSPSLVFINFISPRVPTLWYHILFRSSRDSPHLPLPRLSFPVNGAFVSLLSRSRASLFVRDAWIRVRISELHVGAK